MENGEWRMLHWSYWNGPLSLLCCVWFVQWSSSIWRYFELKYAHCLSCFFLHRPIIPSYHFFFLYFYHCFIIISNNNISSISSNNSSSRLLFLLEFSLSLYPFVLMCSTRSIHFMLLPCCFFFSLSQCFFCRFSICSFSSCIFFFFVVRRLRLAVLMNHFFNVFRFPWIKTWRYLNEDVCKRFCACAFAMALLLCLHLSTNSHFCTHIHHRTIAFSLTCVWIA